MTSSPKVKNKGNLVGVAKALPELWSAIDALRKRADPVVFRHAALEIATLKHLWNVSRVQPPSPTEDVTETQRPAERAIRLPREARWPAIWEKRRRSDLAEALDAAFSAVLRKNTPLRRIVPLSLAQARLDTAQLRRLIELVDRIDSESDAGQALDQIATAYLALLVRFSPSARLRTMRAAILETVFTGQMAPIAAAAAEYDILPLGPKYYKHPNVPPFLLSPKKDFNQDRPQVAFNGQNYLVIWGENHFTEGYWLMGCRVTPQGKVLDPGGFVISKWGLRLHYRVAGGKDNTGAGVWFVVWQDQLAYYAIRGARVAADGKVSVAKRTPKLLLDIGGPAAVTSGGTDIFPDIEDHFNPWMEYSATADYMWPDVAFNGLDFVVVCMYGNDIVARLVDAATGRLRLEQPVTKNVVYPAGKPLTVKIPITVQGLWALNPRIASNGNGQCLVTWNETMPPSPAGMPNGKLYGVKLNFAGSSWTLGIPAIIAPQSEASYGYCSVASDGAAGYFAAWHDRTLAPKKKVNPWDSWCSDLFKAGITTVPGKPLQFTTQGLGALYTANHEDYYPQVAFDGANYLVIWNGFTSDVGLNLKLGCLKAIVVAAYLSPNGSSLDSFIIEPEDGGHASMGDIAFGPASGLLVYWHSPPKGIYYTWQPSHVIRGRLVARST